MTNWVHDAALGALRKIGATVVANPTLEPWPRNVLLGHLRRADAMVAFMPDRIDDAILDQCARLKFISCALKGYDNIDLAACKRRNIQVAIVEDLLTEPGAELAIGHMIALGRHVLTGDQLVRQGGHQGWRPRLYGLGLAQSTIGFLGFGAISQAIARRLAPFGCADLLCYDTSANARDAAEAMNVRALPMPDVLSCSDFVVLGLPLSSTTLGLMNHERISQMKPGALLVNVARGSLVDETAIAAALRAGQLGGYAADVFAFEDLSRADRPSDIDADLLADPTRTLFTPHLGSAVDRVRRQIAEAAATSAADFLQGRRPAGLVT